MRPLTLAAASLALFTLLGCDPAVLDPEVDSNLAPQEAKGSMGPAVHRVTGGGGVDLSTIFGTPFKIRSQVGVSAFLDAEGQASGSFGTMFHRPPGSDPTPGSGNSDWRLAVTVDCMEVEGNTAWISGPATRVKSDLPFPDGPELGRTVVMMARDLGPQDDRVVVIAAVFLGVDDCHDRPDPDPYFFAAPNGGGNLSIR